VNPSRKGYRFPEEVRWWQVDTGRYWTVPLWRVIWIYSGRDWFLASVDDPVRLA